MTYIDPQWQTMCEDAARRDAEHFENKRKERMARDSRCNNPHCWLRDGGPDLRVARPLDQWHEDYGPVVWWIWEAERNRWLGQPSYIGSPLDSDWIEDMYTHWTPHPEFPMELTR